MPLHPKIYLITRADLSDAQKAVQCCHALQDLFRSSPQMRNGLAIRPIATKVICVVPSLAWLEQWHRKTVMKCAEVGSFNEPNQNDELTAIAVYNPPKNFFASLPLM